MKFTSGIFRALISTALAVLIVGPACAQTPLTIAVRNSEYYITFPTPDSALTTYLVETMLPAGGGNYAESTINYKTGNMGVITVAEPDLTTTFPLFSPPGTSSASGSITNLGLGGTFLFVYTTPNGPDFNSSWTESTTAAGFNVISFGGPGTNGIGGCGSSLLSTGGTFACEINIAGDWPIGHAPGDVYLTGLSSGYTVADDFNYSAGYTTFSVVNTNYQGVNPDVSFNLVISPVPEPSTWILMLAGFAGLVWATRRAARGTAPMMSAAA